MVSVSGFVGERREVSVEDGAGRGRKAAAWLYARQAMWSAVIGAGRKQTGLRKLNREDLL